MITLHNSLQVFLPVGVLDKRKDVFLDAEVNGRGERVVIAQYLELISDEMYSNIIASGKITQNEEFEAQLQQEAEVLKLGGLDATTIKFGT